MTAVGREEGRQESVSRPTDCSSTPLHSETSLDQDQGPLVDCMELGQTSQKSPEADGILQSLRSLSGSKVIIDEFQVFCAEFC